MHSLCCWYLVYNLSVCQVVIQIDRILWRGFLGATEGKRDAIRLDQFLKLRGVAGSGGQAKLLIQDGQVTVNGEVETRRGRKLQPGDVVVALGEELAVDSA